MIWIYDTFFFLLLKLPVALTGIGVGLKYNKSATEIPERVGGAAARALWSLSLELRSPPPPSYP